MKKTLQKIVLIAIFFPFSIHLAHAASNYTVNCPEKITVTQHTTAAYPGWRVFTSEPNYYLSGVTLYSGKPEERASLVPDTSNHTKSRWNFSSNDQIYIACEYNQTNIQLTQALPAHTTSCTVLHDPNVRSGNGGYLPRQIQCTSNK